jgi:hypothetical protein
MRLPPRGVWPLRPCKWKLLSRVRPTRMHVWLHIVTGDHFCLVVCVCVGGWVRCAPCVCIQVRIWTCRSVCIPCLRVNNEHRLFLQGLMSRPRVAVGWCIRHRDMGKRITLLAKPWGCPCWSQYRQKGDSQKRLDLNSKANR